jgi:hypothetical protein
LRKWRDEPRIASNAPLGHYRILLARPKRPKMDDVMGSEGDWAERVRRFVNEYDEQANRRPLIHPDNFDLFVETRTVASWRQFQEVFGPFFQQRSWVFRGHHNSAYRLETALERACCRTFRLTGDPLDFGPTWALWMPNKFERDLLLQFQRRAHQYIQNPPHDSAVLDWLALMQHHGVPTRLLDWTFSPYVALYFAFENSRPDTDCALWAVDTDWITKEAHETLRKDSRFPKAPNVRAFNDYLDRVLFDDTNPNVIVMVNPIKMNDRTAAQQGVFLYDLSHTGAFDLPLLQMLVMPALPTSPVIWKFIIKPAERVRFLRELNRMNIHAASLFPGLDGFARSLKLNLEVEIDGRLRAANLEQLSGG